MMTARNSSWRLMTAIMMLGVIADASWAFRGGPPAGMTASPASSGASCTLCHGSAAGPGSVQILGFPANYAPSTNYDLTVKIADATKLGAGFQISVEKAGGVHAGVLTLLDATNTQFNTGNVWVNHTSTGVNNSVAAWGANGNMASYPVRWTSPAVDEGPITAYAAGNAINSNFSSSGDTIYLANTTATFAPDVPTVSQWGITTIALLLLTGGTVILGRRVPT